MVMFLQLEVLKKLRNGFIEENGKRISLKDLKEIDLHKPFVDKILFEKNGKDL